MAVSLMGIPVADEPKDSVMWKEADAFMAQMSPTLQPTQRDAIFTAINNKINTLIFPFIFRYDHLHFS